MTPAPIHEILTIRLLLYISNTTANINIIQEACSAKNPDKNGHLLGLVPHTSFCLFDPFMNICTSFRSTLLSGPAPCKRGNLGPWSAPVAWVHPRTVQQHSRLPFKGLRDPENMAMESGGGGGHGRGPERLRQPPGRPGQAGQGRAERSRK